MSQRCPQCGHTRQLSDTASEGICPSCGTRIREADYAPTRRRRLSLQAAMVAAVVVCAVLIAIKGATSGVGLVQLLISIPFFLCFVPVLTYVFGEGVYSWDNKRMQFVIFDSQLHPVRSKIFFVLYAAISVTFAVGMLGISGPK